MLRRGAFIQPPSNFKVLRAQHEHDIGRCMNMVLETKKLGLVPISHLVHCDNLFQNVTYITAKCDSYIIKCVKRLLQNESVTLLQNVTGIIKHDSCVTRYDVYYKTRGCEYRHTRKMFLKNLCQLFCLQKLKNWILKLKM